MKAMRHRVFPSDSVGDPAEEGPRQAVGDAIEGQRRRDGRHDDAEDRDGCVSVDAEGLSEALELGDDHQPARRHHRHHDEHEPENARLQHLARRKARALLTLRHRPHASRARHPAPQKKGGEKANGRKHRAKNDQRLLVARRPDHVVDREGRQNGAEAIT